MILLDPAVKQAVMHSMLYIARFQGVLSLMDGREISAHSKLLVVCAMLKARSREIPVELIEEIISLCSSFSHGEVQHVLFAASCSLPDDHAVMASWLRIAAVPNDFLIGVCGL
jgi:hypothetical protein